MRPGLWLVSEVCVLGRLDQLKWRGLSASKWLMLLLASLAICEPSMVRRTLTGPLRPTAPINAEPEPVETVVTLSPAVPVARVSVEAVATLTVSRVPYSPESPLAPAWLASALGSALASAYRPLRC